MKRVFTVNNGFTERMAHHIIATEGLSANDCLLMYVRRGSFGVNPQVESSIRTVCYDNNINHSSIWRVRHEVRKVRTIVASEFGAEDYVCYAHHTRSRLAQALIGSDSCLGYYVVEEGIGAYVDVWPEPIRSALRRYAVSLLSGGSLARFGSQVYCTTHRKFLGAIAASEHAFPNVEKKRVVGWPFAQAPDHDAIKALLVFEGPQASESLMRDAIRRFSDHCWQNVFTEVVYKFHPRQGENFRNRMRDYLGQVGREYGLRFVELPGAVLEDICFTRGPEMAVYFVMSSVGFYAAMMGCRAVSLARFYSGGGNGVSEATARRLTRLIESLPKEFVDRTEFV